MAAYPENDPPLCAACIADPDPRGGSACNACREIRRARERLLIAPEGHRMRDGAHAAQLEGWTRDELKAHLARMVDAAPADGDPTPLDIALELLAGEVEGFVLFARTGHLDPPRPDGTFRVAIVRQRSHTDGIDRALESAIRGWIANVG